MREMEFGLLREGWGLKAMDAGVRGQSESGAPQ